jgi:hypothetical protein
MLVSILSGIMALLLWSLTDTSLRRNHAQSPDGKISSWGVFSIVLVQIVLWTMAGFFAAWIVPHLPQFFLTGWRFPITVFGSSILQWFALFMIAQYLWLVLRSTVRTLAYAKRVYGGQSGTRPQ